MNERILIEKYRSYLAVAEVDGIERRWTRAMRGCVSAAENGWSPSDEQCCRVDTAMFTLFKPRAFDRHLEPLPFMLSGFAAFTSTFLTPRIVPNGLPMVLTILIIGIAAFVASTRYLTARRHHRILAAEQVLIDEVPSYSPYPMPRAVWSGRNFRDHGPDIERIP